MTGYYATITQTRHGWRAEYHRCDRPMSTVAYGSSWRRTREAVERAADRRLNRLNTAAQERDRLAATSYVFDRARTARAD